MINLILSIALIVAIANWLKWHITTLAFIYYMQKRRIPEPGEKEMRKCVEFVVKNMIEDFLHPFCHR